MDRAGFFHSDEDATRAYIAFGRIAVNWGAIEVCFEDMLIFLRLRRGVNRVNDFPGSYSAVCKELLKRWRAEEVFAERLPDLERAINEANDLHEIRVNVVHGICQGANVDGLIMFGKSKRREGYAYKTRNFRFDELEGAADRMIQLKSDLEPLSVFTRQKWQRNADGTPYYWHREQGAKVIGKPG